MVPLMPRTAVGVESSSWVIAPLLPTTPHRYAVVVAVEDAEGVLAGLLPHADNTAVAVTANATPSRVRRCPFLNVFLSVRGRAALIQRPSPAASLCIRRRAP